MTAPLTCGPPAADAGRLRRFVSRFACVIVAVLVLLVVPLLLSSPALASSDDEDAIVRYHQDVVLGEDGVADVTLELDVDFGTEPNRGPVLWYPVKQPFPAEDPTDRVYRMRDFEVTSSTGANTEVEVEEDGSLLEVRIGEEDEDDFTGVHSYRITSRVEGWVNAADHFEDLEQDELFLNVTSGWDLPVSDIQVTVTGPAEVVGAGCAAVEGEQPCTDAEHSGPTAVFVQDELDRHEPLTVRTFYPAGTFAGVEPILQDRWTVGTAFAPHPGALALTGLVAVGGLGAVGARVRRHGLDEQFHGLTPGLTPAPGQEVTIGPRRRDPVAVRFSPPEGLRPGQLGTLIDEVADPHDVTATLVDLAVRGHLRIEQVEAPDDEGDDGDWQLVRLTHADDGALLAFERLLLDEVFEDRDTVALSDLRTTFASSMAEVQKALYADVVQQGWFRRDPSAVRNAWVAGHIGLLLLGLLTTVLLALWTSWALVGIAVVVVAVVGLTLTGATPARTAAGSAVLVQTEGFRHYLATAEAEQIRFEEGEDVFSRYLPFAIAFGLADRWAKVFADLAAQGHDLPEPTWYVGPAYVHGAFWASAGTFTRDLTSFTHATETAISTPTAGASGSGGTTFAGGGVGGGGGGTW